ncbi:HpsJ-like protein, cyanoexosortase A-associated [Planktothrix pseudagardhii]|uniref:HpsJ-like protein, cyanoexosortase A-associated n=1 Tax=Planktothrix pseudagardhii TaxID=132604 RepID=UPI002665AE4E|nr:HpsJ family protein [Planktothrix pseudagardhii]
MFDLLVFYGEHIGRENWEFPLVKLLSWLTLLVGLLFLLLIPLGVFNTIRLDKQAQSQISSQVQQNITQIQEVKKQLATTQTAEEMKALLRRLDNQGRAPDIQTSEQLQKVKDELSNFISKTENQLSNQASIVQSGQRLTLLKNSIKWNLGALISGTLFIIIWRSTRWAR